MINNIFKITKSCVGLELLNDSVVNKVKCSNNDAVLLRLNLLIVRHAHRINEPTPTATHGIKLTLLILLHLKHNLQKK